MSTKKYASLNTLQTFLDNLKNIFATKSALDEKANTIHTHEISDITNLQSSLDDVNVAIAQKSQAQIITWEDDD